MHRYLTSSRALVLPALFIACATSAARASYTTTDPIPDGAPAYVANDPIVFTDALGRKNYVGHVTLIKQRTDARTVSPDTGGVHVEATYGLSLEFYRDSQPHWVPPVYLTEPLAMDFAPVQGTSGLFSATLTDVAPVLLQTDDGPVLLRVGHTETSKGELLQRFVPADPPTIQCDSFFDIWVDMSLDGGLTWIPGDGGPTRASGLPEPTALAVLPLAGAALGRRRR
jgi:hypothetical protein